MKFVGEIHAADVALAQSQEIEGSYNPPKFGRVYYFHQHGCQICKIRAFTAEKNGASNTKFRQVSKKGTSWLRFV